MARIPDTIDGLTDEKAVEAGALLRKGWDVLRSLQFNKKVSILRYEVSGDGRPDLGIDDQRQLVDGLSDLDVYVSRVSTREVIAGRGKIELTDMLFVFYAEIRDTDEILYNGKTYKVVQIRYWDPDIGRSMVIARAT